MSPAPQQVNGVIHTRMWNPQSYPTKGNSQHPSDRRRRSNSLNLLFFLKGKKQAQQHQAVQFRKGTPVHVEILKKELAEWSADGVIAHSDSPWSSPLVPFMKKDGSVRWAIDFRALNLHSKLLQVVDVFPPSTSTPHKPT